MDDNLPVGGEWHGADDADEVHSFVPPEPMTQEQQAAELRRYAATPEAAKAAIRDLYEHGVGQLDRWGQHVPYRPPKGTT